MPKDKQYVVREDDGFYYVYQEVNTVRHATEQTLVRIMIVPKSLPGKEAKQEVLKLLEPKD